MNKTKKITIGLYALSIFLIFGISYAYFSLNIIGNEDAKLSVITAGTLELTYTDGSGDVILENVIPGSSIQKEITVKNTGTLDTAYNLVWGEMINEFENDEIVLSATCERLNSEGVVEGTCNNIEEKPVINNIIQKNISIESGITHKYTITVTFIETGENQNYNQGKVFGGIININEYSNIAGTLKNKFYEVSGMTDRSLVKTISFYSDNRVIDGAESYDVSEGQDGSVKMYVKQNGENSSLYDLTIVADGKIAFPEDSSNLFSFNIFGYCGSMTYLSKTSLTSINFNDSVDTSRVKNMYRMFAGSNLTNLDLSSFNTSSVTNMNSMFYFNKSENINLSGLNTRNVVDMSSMFAYSEFISLDLSSFNTPKVTNMNNMFNGSKATLINLSSFNTRNVTNMSSMFSSIQATELDLSSFNTSNVTDMSYMFSNSQVTELDLSNFDTSKVTNMRGMFESTQVKTVDLSNFDTHNVTDMGSMFENSQLTTINVNNFDTSTVTKMGSMFANCQVTELDLSNFDTSTVTNMSRMFKNSAKLKTIYASNKFKTNNVTSDNQMFSGCTSLVGGSGTAYSQNNSNNIAYAQIDSDSIFRGYFTAK